MKILLPYAVFIVLSVCFAFLGFLFHKKFVRRKVLRRGKVLPHLKPTEGKNEAGEQLLVYLNEEFKVSGKEIAVYEGVNCSDGSGWVFFWDAAAFIVAKNQLAAFAGSNPIYFNKQTGEIRYIQPQFVGQYIGQAQHE